MGNLKAEIECILTEAQNNAITINHVKVKIYKIQQNN